MTATFVVARSDLRRTQWIETTPAALQEGQLRLRIGRFALTSNNVTYAAFGEAMKYWDFFPTGDVKTGCIPVWGFATVVESRSVGVEAGERFYGYLPMADDIVLTPVRVSDSGFFDGAAHRRELHSVYNQYLRCSADPAYHPADEALIALLRPLFVTSFLIDDFLADNGFFGARQALISSASSKTAYGLGFCLAKRRQATGGAAVVGLTSPANREFSESLGCYDNVAIYDEVTQLPADTSAVYVDMSGSVSLRSAIHRHWNDKLAHSCSVGGTHWNELGSGKGLPGPRPQLFFAPAQIKKRSAEWGAAELQNRIAMAWQGFIARVSDPAQPWLRIVAGQGRADIETAYAALLDGRIPAVEGHVLAV